MRDSYFYLKSVSAQFSMIAEEKPRAVAIVDGDGHAIDYGTLNSRAKLLAASLQQRGVEIEDSIGLLLDRSIELYIGMLAIHKCGACYVPLDPTWPGKRHEFIVADTKCKIILTTSKQPIPPFLKDKTILLDQFDWTSALPSKTVFPELDLDSIAYILYTSGSTGTPKGVEVQHDGLANFVLWQNTIFPHTGEYRMTQAARPSFDASCSEIWPAFCCGATLYIIPESLLLHISELAYWLFDKKIDECFLPTPLAELLMENGMPPHSSLKLLRTGGERLMGKPPKGFPAPILNEYGPTECSIVSTYSIYYPGDSREPLPDIGVAIQDMAVHILDEDLQPLPVGKPGEICISGIGLARGYHNRPDLDAVAFVKNPKNPSERLYRTGDIGIQTYEDRFDFVDRKDFQVKLRGQRIELGEIEKVILSHPDVKKSIALMRESKSGGKYIAVYITVKDNRTDIKEELLKLSQESLPEYMIPSTISVLESFPLTERGKVDRDAFPEPDQDETKWEAPKGNVEKKLSILWQKQLNSSPPGREDHFFRLGGDSLSAAILSVRIGEEFNFDSCAELLFEYPKLMDLAAFVEKKAGTGTKIGLSREKEDAARMLFPATSYQVAQWKLQTYSDAGNLNNIVMMIHIRGNVDLIRFQQVLTRIVQNNAAFRSGFSWNGKHLMQRVMPELSVEMPFHNWVAKSSTLQQQLLKQELGVQQNRCFNLDSPPLFYAKLIQIEDQRYEFIFTVCHLIFDGWSGALFLTELRDNYDRLASHLPLLDKAQELPDYPDFAIQHQKMLHSGFFTEGLAAWEKMLESFTPMPKLPFEHADSEINYNAAGRYQMTIPEGLCSRLRAFAENSGSTLFTLLQAVLQIQLHKYTGAVDIVTGTAVANRRIRNSENMIGMFINSLPVRHHCNPEKSFNSFFESFHYTIMQCKKYSDVPLDLIVDHLNISSKKTPLFTVSLLLQNLPWPENDSAKLEMGYDEYGSGIAKTDITLVMEERGKTLDCHVEFREALFSQNVIEEFCAGFLTLATTLLDAPEIPITTLSCPSPMGTRPGAYVLGDTGVVPACGDVLLKSGFYIHGVLSSDPIVLDWAKKERIPCESLTGKTLQAVLTRIPFDYLFSIINGCILKENILKLPRKMAINYHDSPLPRYAGLNACSWAVVNGEKTHGITWHRMNEKIDAGEILKQRIFPVPVNATATQLSLKCSEECVAAFSELAEELFNGTQTLTVPDRSQYTCFPSSRRPFAGGMMDWRKTSEELCALVRGLVFELYDNELTCPKFVYHGTLIIVGDAQVVDSKKNHAPGIITERGDQTITVSSG
ncbi:MAG: amino acid adenylation domain-containing protein, partial [Lentisphaeria bacterium]